MSIIVFPGQGSQYINMAKDFYDNYQISRDVFDLVSENTKIDIKNIIFNSDSKLLNQTQYTQLSIFCSSLSIYKVLEKIIGIDKLNIKVMLGHSLGEYTSLAASKIVSIEECSKLLKIRSELMQNAYEPNKSGMAAVIGLNCKKVQEIIDDNNFSIEVANDNSPSQVVISGITSELIESQHIFKEAGIKKFILLNVSAAFHSRLMKNAENNLCKYINKTNFNESKISIISNYSGIMSNNINEIVHNLSHQMSNRVRWVESINTLINTSHKKIIEIGPGNVLSALIKRITNNFDIVSIDNISDIDKIRYGV